MTSHAARVARAIALFASLGAGCSQATSGADSGGDGSSCSNVEAGVNCPSVAPMNTTACSMCAQCNYGTDGSIGGDYCNCDPARGTWNCLAAVATMPPPDLPA